MRACEQALESSSSCLSAVVLRSSMLPDNLPHALSLLQALRLARVRALAAPRIELRAADGSDLDLRRDRRPERERDAG